MNAYLEEEKAEVAATAKSDDDKDVTVFVNAANWPMGRRRAEFQWQGQSQFGGPGFRPVVVDVMD